MGRMSSVDQPGIRHILWFTLAGHCSSMPTQHVLWMALAPLLAALNAGTKWGTQFPCPAGTYSSQAGNSQAEDCLPCPAGAFCPRGTPKPVLCPRGTSRQSPGARLAVACVLCPAGHHCPELGTATPRPCSAGSFSGPGRLWCQECPGGKLCNQTKLASPLACPPGHYCPAQGLLSIPCPRGTFREAPGAAHMEDCQPCRSGTFCGKAGLAEPQGLCRPGYHCGPGSNTSSPEGLPFGDLCPPGHFCPAGTKDPRQRPCPAGTWNAEKGAPDVSWCLPCPPGLFCAEAGQAAPRGPCAPGEGPRVSPMTGQEKHQAEGGQPATSALALGSSVPEAKGFTVQEGHRV
uniref:SCO-spondin n=1 Tax=Camelus bactrianus TaxID=9837 RepID=A0A9W3G0B3_CAMBA|nr:SCO-spondin [Camelus bactrianus]